ncbi:MAG: acetylornithine deacetylase [Pseudomonadota bacterium]
MNARVSTDPAGSALLDSAQPDRVQPDRALLDRPLLDQTLLERALLERTKAILADLVAFPSVSGLPNDPIVSYVERYLADHGIATVRDTHPDGQRANVFATIGPEVDGGTILCGHMDVVPADPSGWTTDPFTLTERDGRLFGRGAVDMKGFLAISLAMVPEMVAADLAAPIHLAFTFDEETASFGAAQFRDFLRVLPNRPATCIVGEPTCMIPYIGHKGGMELLTRFEGLAGHASIPANGLNTIYFAARLVDFLRRKADALAAAPVADTMYDPPYTTINVGRISGGEAGNIIPDTCDVEWEIRPLPEDDGIALLDEIKAFITSELLPEMQAHVPDANVRFIKEHVFPGMAIDPDARALKLVRSFWQTPPADVVSFGTDACYIQETGISTLVIGAGDISTAHLPDEYIETSALETGLAFIAGLIEHHAKSQATPAQTDVTHDVHQRDAV